MTNKQEGRVSRQEARARGRIDRREDTTVLQMRAAKRCAAVASVRDMLVAVTILYIIPILGLALIGGE